MLLNVIQLLNVPAMFYNEKKSAMPYSKFASSRKEEKNEGKTVPSRVGMLIIYVPALIVASLYLALAGSNRFPHYSAHIAAWMTFLHFLKRTLETVFLHKYSGSIVASAANMIGFAYASQSALICGTATSSPGEGNVWVASILFSIGIVGNFYHHYLLASLRTKEGKTVSVRKYTAPRGGLFVFVAAPHYLFELIGWLGIAVASEQITSYLMLGGMVAYLSARSMNQNEWNHARFSEKEWPASRKNLIPFVF